VTTFVYSSASPAAVAAGLLVLPVFEGGAPGPGVKEAGLREAFAASKLTGKAGETLLVPRRESDGFAAGAALLVGVGPKDAFDVTAMRRALGKAAPVARRFGTVATTFPLAFGAARSADAVQAAAEGLGLGGYRFGRYKTGPADGADLETVTVLGSPKWDAKRMKAAVARAGILVDAVCWARDLVNTPAGDLPPAAMADAARAMAKEVGLTCKIWNEAQLADKGFGGILGVGKGSVQPPRLIELTYTGAGKATPIALTGKGISFDSGGLSLTDPGGMETMKCDMGGAITAALFLAEFVDDTPWVHLDIAGPAFHESAHDLGPAGATGVPVRALVRFVLDRAG